MESDEQFKDEVRRGAQAAEILRHPAFIDAFESLRRDLQRQMSAVKATDERTKNKLIDMWQLVDGLERWFVKTIETGQAAEIQLQERKKFNIFKR